jgi:cytochrome c
MTISRFTLPATALLLASVITPAQAQSVNIGRSLFVAQCASAGCHNGTVPRVANNGGAGANNPGIIQSAIQRDKGGMGYLSSMLSTSDINDIAHYLGNYTQANANPSEADRLLNWAEWKFQTLLQPRATSQQLSGYTVRQYTNANLYVGIANGQVYTYTPGGSINSIGSTASYLGTAAADGF